jgi:hypothetical protein
MSFGINRKELINNLEIIRKHLCSYSTNICDCKYGPNLKPKADLILSSFENTESTGCPEIRQVISILSVLTDREFNKLVRKAKILIT